jgi:SPP1 family predicted phage head-tail adaptor
MRIGSKKGNYVDANTMYSEIGLYAPTSTPDGQGGYETTFALQETVFGDFRPENENRALLEAELSFTRSAKLFIRYDVTINNNYQIEAEGEMYTIHSIKDVENQFRFYEILMYA